MKESWLVLDDMHMVAAGLDCERVMILTGDMPTLGCETVMVVLGGPPLALTA